MKIVVNPLLRCSLTQKEPRGFEDLVYYLINSPDKLCVSETLLTKDDKKDMFVIKAFLSVCIKIKESRGGSKMIQITTMFVLLSIILSTLMNH